MALQEKSLFATNFLAMKPFSSLKGTISDEIGSSSLNEYSKQCIHQRQMHIAMILYFLARVLARHKHVLATKIIDSSLYVLAGKIVPCLENSFSNDILCFSDENLVAKTFLRRNKLFRR